MVLTSEAYTPINLYLKIRQEQAIELDSITLLFVEGANKKKTSQSIGAPGTMACDK